jgi:hypothetical protein
VTRASTNDRRPPRFKSALEIQAALDRILAMELLGMLPKGRAQAMTSILRTQLECLKASKDGDAVGDGAISNIEPAAQILAEDPEMLEAIAPLLPPELLRRLMAHLN